MDYFNSDSIAICLVIELKQWRRVHLNDQWLQIIAFSVTI